MMAQQLSQGLAYLQGTRELREYEYTKLMCRTSSHTQIIDTLNEYQLSLEHKVRTKDYHIKALEMINKNQAAKLKEYGIS